MTAAVPIAAALEVLCGAVADEVRAAGARLETAQEVNHAAVKRGWRVDSSECPPV